MIQKIDKLRYLQIGVQGENIANDIQIDVSEWVEAYPGASIHLLFKPYNAVAPSPMTISVEDGILTWQPSLGATVVTGVGYTEVRAIDPETGMIKKSRIIPTAVENSVSGVDSEDPPAPFEDWVNSVLQASEDAVNAKTVATAAKAAAEAARDAAQAAAGDFQGLSAEVETLTPGSDATIDVTHEEGGLYNFTFGIPKGEKGDKGETGDPAPADQVVPAVDDWLDDHITNPSNPPLDTSLSLSNAAAPANLVGELKSALNELNDDMYSHHTELSQIGVRKGFAVVSTGKYAANANTVSGYGGGDSPLVFARDRITVNSGYEIRYAIWGVPFSSSTSSDEKLYGPTAYISGPATITIPETGYLAFSIRYADQRTLPDELTAEEIAEAATDCVITTGNKLEAVKNITDFLYNNVFSEESKSLEWLRGAWLSSGASNNTDTYIKTGAFQTNKAIVRVNAGYRIMISKWGNASASTSSWFLGDVLGSPGATKDVREFSFSGTENEWFRIAVQRADKSTIEDSDQERAIVSANVHIYEQINRIDNLSTRIDAKEDTEHVNLKLAAKINKPIAGYGTAGQVLTSDGTENPIWTTPEPASEQVIVSAVNAWLENNPQAFLSIEDRSILEVKFNQSALRYITPAMFGAVGDGETPDDVALQSAIDYAMANHVILDGKGKTYAIEGNADIMPPWSQYNNYRIKGLYANRGITIQNMNLFVLDNALEGTSALHVTCRSGERVLIDNVNVDGNRTHQSSTVQGDGNMGGIKVGYREQYNPYVPGANNEGIFPGSIIIRNCYLHDCYTDGLTCLELPYESFVVENCVFEGNGRNGFTDCSMGGIVRGCLFRNNGTRTAPFTQYEVEPEGVRPFTTRVIEDCIFESDNRNPQDNNADDFVFLLKAEKIAQQLDTSIEHLVISNCLLKKGISIQSQTTTRAAIFKHITIKDCTCNEIRFHPASEIQSGTGVVLNHIADNRDMKIVNCHVSSINITKNEPNADGATVSTANVTIDKCKIDGIIILDTDNLSMENNRIKVPNSSSIRVNATDDFIMTDNSIETQIAGTILPSAANGVIDGNIFKNCTLNTEGVTNCIGTNLPVVAS